jgi:PAS domain S-box-containing protein
LIIIVGSIWGINEHKKFEIESEHLKSEYIGRQKHLIKTEVQRAVAQVIDIKNQTEIHLKESIRTRVHEAYAIATNLYHQFHDSMTDAEVKRMVVEALRNIRFSHGRGYYFATDFDGIEQLFADHPELESQDVSGMQDSAGRYVIRDMIEIAKNSGEGYYRYLWTKPNAEGDDHLKIAYVKHFEPFNWFIGTGEYFENIEDELQNEILKRLIKIRFGSDGYLFGSTYDGKALFTGGKITKGTNSIWELTDPNGIKIIQEQRKATLNEEGDFYYYSWKKLDSSVPSPKLSFSMGIADWNWMIGAGVYTDEIDQAIAVKREILNNQIRSQLIKLIIILLGIFLVTVFITLYISSKTHQVFSKFLQFFGRASSDYVQIDASGMFFSEFKQIADLANQVIVDREKAKQALIKSELLLRDIAANYPCYLSIIKEDYTVVFSSGKEFEKQGFNPEKFIGVHIRDIFGEKAGYIQEQYKAAFEGKEVQFELEFDNQYQLYTVAPLSSENGTVDQILSVVENITKRKQAEEKIKASLKEKETLLHEIHHRVKNNMQVINSLLKLQSNTIKDDQIKDILKENQNRIYAMSAVHETLHGSEKLSEIDLQSYLPKITTSIFQTYSTDSRKINLNSDIDNSLISLNQAYPLGLIINELISNSLKYAFPDEKEGEIKVSLKKQDKELELILSDDGVGMSNELDWKNGNTLGLKLVRTLVENQLDGSIDMDNNNGTKFTIKLNIGI